MNYLIKNKIICFLLIVTPVLSFSQPLSQGSAKVKKAWEELNKYPKSKQKQLAYIKAFPGNEKLFMEIFEPTDFKQLYSDSHQFIPAFIQLSKYYPTEVIEKSINIGKDLIWEADATGDMQHGIVDLGIENIKLFSKKLNALPKLHRHHLIKFLADVENHKAYHEYQQLIDLLNKAGETQLANEFIDARSKREKVKHD